MAHILDLKNKQAQQTGPEDDPGFGVERKPTAQEQPMNHVFSWSGHLYPNSSFKTVILAAIILFAIAVLVQIFQKSIMTTIFFALLGAVLLLNALKKQRLEMFEINPAGIKIDDHLYDFRHLGSFWIEYDLMLGIKELSLQTKKWYMPYVKIPIAEQNPVQLRNILLEFLPEVEHKDTLIEVLARKLGL